jgi:hypothetical protein
MIHPAREKPKSKAIAELLAMIADAHPDISPPQPRPVRASDQWLWAEFCAALDRYAGRTTQSNIVN